MMAELFTSATCWSRRLKRDCVDSWHGRPKRARGMIPAKCPEGRFQGEPRLAFCPCSYAHCRCITVDTATSYPTSFSPHHITSSSPIVGNSELNSPRIKGLLLPFICLTVSPSNRSLHSDWSPFLHQRTSQWLRWLPSKPADARTILLFSTTAHDGTIPRNKSRPFFAIVACSASLTQTQGRQRHVRAHEQQHLQLSL